MTPKEAAPEMPKRSRFRTPFDSQRVNGSQSLHHFSTIVLLTWDKLIFKKLLLVRCKILGLFLNTMTTDQKISRLNRE